MKIFFAPLQGYTEYAYRKAHQEVCGGVDAYSWLRGRQAAVTIGEYAGRRFVKFGGHGTWLWSTCVACCVSTETLTSSMDTISASQVPVSLVLCPPNVTRYGKVISRVGRGRA